MAAVADDERRAEAELELEAAAILCDLKRILRARDRRRRRQQQKRGEAPVIPSWGRRRLRSALEKDAKPSAAERDGAASPDTPLAFRVPEEEDEEEEEEDKKARAQAEWVQEQRVVVASLSREKADLLKQIEEYRARLMSSKSANDSLKQLHKVRQQEQEARKTQALPLRHIPNPRRHPLPALGLDLNEPADEAAARAVAAQQQWYWQVQQQQKAAVTAEARRRRLEVLRAKPASSSWSRTRRAVG